MTLIMNMSLPGRTPGHSAPIVPWRGAGLPLERFRVYPMGADSEEYDPEPMSLVNRAMRQRMTGFLTEPGNHIVASLNRLMNLTRSTLEEHQGFFSADGRMLTVQRGTQHIRGADLPRELPRGAVGFVHTHPLSVNSMAPPSDCDWGLLSFDTVPLQFVAEMTGRLWGVFAGALTTLLGNVTHDSFVVLNDPSIDLQYSIHSGQRVRNARYAEDETQRHALAQRAADRMHAVADERMRHAEAQRRRHMVFRSPLTGHAGGGVEAPIPARIDWHPSPGSVRPH